MAGAVAGAPRVARNSRLSARDWIDAGATVLREQGISGVKLSVLTRRLGVSIGSFYHHFSDFEQYLAALADDYSVERVRHDLDKAAAGDDPSPVARLQRLARQSLASGTFELDLAMRIWATMDERAAAAVRRAEAIVVAFVTQAFAQMGFDAAEASLRARILLAVNVSPLMARSAGSRAEFYRGCLRVLIADAPALVSSAPARQSRRIQRGAGLLR